MQKLKLLEPNLEGLEIYNSSFLDSQIFLPNYKIPQLYDLIREKFISSEVEMNLVFRSKDLISNN